MRPWRRWPANLIASDEVAYHSITSDLRGSQHVTSAIATNTYSIEVWSFIPDACLIVILQAASNVSAAATLLGLSWDSVHTIMERAVERGLERREVDQVRQVGIDEKSFGRGQDYVSLMTDLDGSRVLEVVPGRDE